MNAFVVGSDGSLQYVAVTRFGANNYDPPVAPCPPTVVLGEFCLRLEVAEAGRKRRSLGLGSSYIGNQPFATFCAVNLSTPRRSPYVVKVTLRHPGAPWTVPQAYYGPLDRPPRPLRLLSMEVTWSEISPGAMGPFESFLTLDREAGATVAQGQVTY